MGVADSSIKKQLSRQLTSIKETKNIAFDFKLTHIPKYDQYFVAIGSLLERAEKIRADTQGAKERALFLANTCTLRSSKVRETLKILTWSLSAHAAGDIQKLEVRVSSDEPYFAFQDSESIHEETRELCYVFKKFIRTSLAGFEDLKDIYGDLNYKVPQAEALLRNIYAAAEEAGLNDEVTKEAVVAMGFNEKVARDGFNKVAKLYTKCSKYKKEANLIIENWDLYAEEANKIGVLAHSKNIFSPREIFNAFNGAQKGDPFTRRSKKSMTNPS